VCVVETTALEILPFDGVSEAFCAAYAESDGTVAGWRALNWPIYHAQCHDLGRTPREDMPLVCETFEVVYPDQAAARATAARLRERASASAC
jgi:uncharacterized protein YhfF